MDSQFDEGRVRLIARDLLHKAKDTGQPVQDKREAYVRKGRTPLGTASAAVLYSTAARQERWHANCSPARDAGWSGAAHSTIARTILAVFACARQRACHAAGPRPAAP